MLDRTHSPNIGNFTDIVNGILTGCSERSYRSNYRSMDLVEILKRIDKRLKALDLSDDAASRTAGKRDAIRNMRRAVKAPTGRQGVSTATLSALAPVLETTLAWLLTGEGDERPNSSVPIMGYIGAGAVVEPDYEQVPEHGLDTIDLPFNVPDEIIAFQVKGESMRPSYRDGDAVLVWREQRRATDTFIGEDAAVRTDTGSRYLKEIHGTGRRGVYNLYSHNDRVIENVRLEWVGEIYLVIKGTQLRRLNRQQRTTAARRERARDVAASGMKELPLDDEGEAA